MANGEKQRMMETSLTKADELRVHAEARLDGLSADDSPLPEGAMAIVHELRVSQIELEMQNEELRAAQLELDEQRAKYFDLFDLAPVGYLTVGDKGIVGDANLTAAHLLGVERQLLVGQPLTAFMLPSDHDAYYLHKRALEQTGRPQACELRLQRPGGDADDEASAGHFWALLECRPQDSADGKALASWVTFTDIDERKREQEKMTYIMKAVESSSDAIGVSDAEGHHIFQNKALSTLFEYETAEELEAAGGGQARVKDPEVAKELFESINSGKSWAGELNMVTKSGRVFPAYERADAINDHEGRTIGLIGIITDITERKRAEEALRDSERWLSESQRIAKLGHYIYDIGRDQWVGSPSLYDVFGVEESYSRDFAGWLEIVHPAERENMSRYFTEEVLGKRAPFDIEYRIVRPRDGVERWVHGLGKVEFHEDGHPLTMFGVIQDITERKLFENELNRERALLAQTEAIGHIGSWRIGQENRGRRWSDELVRILGFAPSPDGGDGFDELRGAVHPDYREVFEEWLKAASVSVEPHRADFRIVRPDGEVRWVCAHGALEEGRDGESTVVAGILHDVTDRKQIEAERVEHLEQVANVDRLTGLHNLRGFDLVAEHAMAQAQRANQGVGLIFCDVDGLKTINDEFGHAQGDRALQDVASILKFTLRSADAIARVGGDEFIVLAVGGDRDSVLHLNERLQEGFDFFNATTARPYRISLSSGTSWCDPGEPCPFEQLKTVADQDMYAEKMRRRRAG